MDTVQYSHRNTSNPALLLIISMVFVFCTGSAVAAKFNNSPFPGQELPNSSLADIQGKGLPVSLPGVGKQTPGVILWDELPGKDGKNQNMQLGMLNVQSNSMTTAH